MAKLPNNITDLLHPYTVSCALRSSDQGLPGGDRAFKAVAPTLWHAHPPALRSADSLNSFIQPAFGQHVQT